MPFTLEHIYRTVGKDDKVSNITFKDNSDSYVRFGQEATVVFTYTQRERETLDIQITSNTVAHGMVKAKVLFFELSKESLLNNKVQEIEFNTKDIEVFYFFVIQLK